MLTQHRNHTQIHFFILISNFNLIHQQLIEKWTLATMSDKSIMGKWVQSGTALFLVLLKTKNSPNKDE